MQFSPDRFNKVINGRAQSMEWRKGYACPCVSRSSGAAAPNCPHCHGKGTLWDDAIPGLAALTERDTLRQWKDFGMLDSGDVVMIISSDSVLYDIGQNDRVIMKNRTVPFSLNLVSGVRDTLRLPVVSLDRIFWFLEDGSLSDGEIPDITPDGVMDFRYPPPPDTTYSVTGRQNPEYFVWTSLPADRPHHQGARLPRRVVLRKWDLYGR